MRRVPIAASGVTSRSPIHVGDMACSFIHLSLENSALIIPPISVIRLLYLTASSNELKNAQVNLRGSTTHGVASSCWPMAG